MSVENTILAHLIHNETYARKVLPFIKTEYFADHANRVIYQTLYSYIDRYNSFPSKEAIAIDVEKINGLSDVVYTSIQV